MDKVRALVAAGSRIPTAVKEALLPLTLEELAQKYALPRPAVSNAINGNVRATDDLIGALIEELGGTENEWRVLLWEAGRPVQIAQ